MARKTTTVTLVANTRKRLDTAAGPYDTDGQDVTYQAAASNTTDVWLGDATVTVGGGIRLGPDGVADEHLSRDEGCWAISSAAATVVVDQIGL